MTKPLGLALGSGGARGLAHIGIIQALDDAGIAIDYVAGSSMGAFVGAMYVAGELENLEAFFLEMDWKMLLSYFDVVFPTSGLLDGNKVYELLTQRLLDLQIEEAAIPFCCVATDLVTGSEVHLRSGPMADAVRASISIPGIFTPFDYNGQFLGDGGIVNPVPVGVAQEMGAGVVIAVNLNHTPPSQTDRATTSATATASEATPALDRLRHAKQSSGDRPQPDTKPSTLLSQLKQHYESIQENFQQKLTKWMPEDRSSLNIFDVIGKTLNVMEQGITRSRLAETPPDLLLQPDLSQYGIFEFHRAETLIQLGYDYMAERLPEVKQLLQD